MSVTYSECVSVALVIQHAWKRMRPIILSSVTCPALQYSSALSLKSHDFQETKWLNIKCVSIFCIAFDLNISHYEKNWEPISSFYEKEIFSPPFVFNQILFTFFLIFLSSPSLIPLSPISSLPDTCPVSPCFCLNVIFHCSSAFCPVDGNSEVFREVRNFLLSLKAQRHWRLYFVTQKES